MTAIIWFGTILYVHILLEPAYAAKGLPSGELSLGWISIVLIAVSWAVLTADSVHLWKTFYTTRFGVLLGMKIFLFPIIAASAAIVTLFIGPRLRRQRSASPGSVDGLSADELCAFDGKEGRPAYIAYKGAVYDVTGSRIWNDGSHLKKHSAGSYLTGIISTAPHGEERVFAMPKIGALKQASGNTARPFHEKLFYFFAYLEMVVVPLPQACSFSEGRAVSWEERGEEDEGYDTEEDLGFQREGRAAGVCRCACPHAAGKRNPDQGLAVWRLPHRTG